MAKAREFPPVKLSTTLHDLLLADILEGGDGENASESNSRNSLQSSGTAPQSKAVRETLCHVKPTSDNQIGPAVLVNNKYLLTSKQIDNGSILAHLQLENCSHLLMFFAGAIDVIFIGCDDHCPDDPTLGRETVDKNAQRSFGVIDETQRPKIKTYANVDDLLSKYEDDFPGQKIRWGFAVDVAEKLPTVFHPEETYMWNTKRWLGVSDTLKSANDTIIDIGLLCPQHQIPARTIQNQGSSQNDPKSFWYYGGADCKNCEQGIIREISRIMDLLNNRTVPYVLKLNQSLSSVGTVIVVTEADRSNLLGVVHEHLESYLPRVTKDNAHILPISLVVSDFVKADTTALNFYIRGGKHAGEVVFLGGCEQLATGQEGRQTTMIRYSEQDRMEKRFRKTLDKIGEALGSTGYFGAAGADVMDDEKGTGNQFVIDLNVRTALSHVLYLLKDHLNGERGYEVALIYECLILTLNRDEFEEKMGRELQEAKVIIIGSTALGEKGSHAYGLVVSGKDQEEMQEISDKMFQWEP